MSVISINSNNNSQHLNMKRVLTTLWLVFTAVMINTTYALEAPETQQQQPASPKWIEVGTVIGHAERTSSNEGYTYYGSNELKLYVMYLGDKLIYRVQWNGSYFPVKQTNLYGNNAVAEIPDFLCIKVYKADGSEGLNTKPARVLFTVPTW